MKDQLHLIAWNVLVDLKKAGLLLHNKEKFKRFLKTKHIDYLLFPRSHGKKYSNDFSKDFGGNEIFPFKSAH